MQLTPVAPIHLAFSALQMSSREQEFAQRAAAVAAAASTTASRISAYVAIRNVSPTTFGSATNVVPRLELPAGVGAPVAIHGGLVLGVAVQGAGEKDVERLLLYDWQGTLLTTGVHSSTIQCDSLLTWPGRRCALMLASRGHAMHAPAHRRSALQHYEVLRSATLQHYAVLRSASAPCAAAEHPMRACALQQALQLLRSAASERRVCAGKDLLPAPRAVSYSPSTEYAALLYRDAVEVFSLHAGFTLLTRVSVHNALDALWLDNTLFTSAPHSVAAHFIIPPAPKGQQLTTQTALFAQSGSDGLPELSRLPTAAQYEVQSVLLATNRISNARPLSTTVTQPELPPLPLRPGMLWKLVRVTQDTLWMVSTTGHGWAMSLRHAGLQCRMLASQGDLVAARKLATSALHHRFHDSLARMFCALGSLGAAEALLLPGVRTHARHACMVG
jgi:hypothetical protein